MVLWGVFLRTVIGLHATWLVNSATHLWGSQRWATGDDSTNNFLIALLTFGEGWHNNHHAHPSSARHGLRWWEIDTNWYVISALRAVGLAHDVKLPQGRQPHQRDSARRIRLRSRLAAEAGAVRREIEQVAAGD